MLSTCTPRRRALVEVALGLDGGVLEDRVAEVKARVVEGPVAGEEAHDARALARVHQPPLAGPERVVLVVLVARAALLVPPAQHHVAPAHRSVAPAHQIVAPAPPSSAVLFDDGRRVRACPAMSLGTRARDRASSRVRTCG
jgi:hypothetical protein